MLMLLKMPLETCWICILIGSKALGNSSQFSAYFILESVFIIFADFLISIVYFLLVIFHLIFDIKIV